MNGTVSDKIIAGGAALYATDPTIGDIWKYNGSPMNWTRIGGPGSMFAANNSTLYGLSPAKDGVWQWTGQPDQWIQIGGPAATIIAGGAALYATNPDTGDIWKYNGSPMNWTLIKTLYLASDGSALTLTRDAQGNIIGAEGIGVDGISRRFTVDTSASSLGEVNYKFFENSVQYLAVHARMPYTRGGFKHVGIDDGSGDAPDAFRYPAYFTMDVQSSNNIIYEIFLDTIHSSTSGIARLDEQTLDITTRIASNVRGGTINLQVPSFASLSAPFTPLLKTLYKDEFSRASYFAPLFWHYKKQGDAQAFAALQAVGLSYNSSPFDLFKMQSITLIPMTEWERAQAIAAALCWGVFGLLPAAGGLIITGVPMDPITAGLLLFITALGNIDASMCDTIIHHILPPSPPPSSRPPAGPVPTPGPIPTPMPTPVPLPVPDPCDACLPGQICVNGVCYDWSPPNDGGDQGQ